MKNTSLYLLVIIIALLLGAASVAVYKEFASSSVYQTQNLSLASEYNSSSVTTIAWSALLPVSERDLLRKYQIDQMLPLNEQILTSLQAANDTDYKAALTSNQTVSTFVDKAVRISGFIVPIDVNQQQGVTRFFLVPYYGACLHYPPPPPNQVIHVTTDTGFAEFDLNQAYTLSGFLRLGLFEDPLGTAAYAFDLVQITPYSGEPDDVRQH
ncbi:DUF3299 domain-containing protein [Alteromonas sediminis]|uniref:DUF3299 domain-containing protein n=1 Tax=Alteromonas sediminis TaxID=2259342 RepID=A0A3N5XXY1_9ALTE|nr:DUF3299 domain-containing protein [Alteromonas sediminis]RPJ65400.1 DUF3299 domain-containing protein [Alteromonas sediminis]